MKPPSSNARLLFLTVCMVLFWVAGDAQSAQRELHWDSLDVDARLAANGVLDVTERHAMVFTGDWNGGERVFNVRPRQKLEFISLEHIEESTGRAEPLRQSIRPNAVDEYSWAGRQYSALAKSSALRPALCEHTADLCSALQAIRRSLEGRFAVSPGS